jgi:hypothetical protein
MLKQRLNPVAVVPWCPLLLEKKNKINITGFSLNRFCVIAVATDSFKLYAITLATYMTGCDGIGIFSA